MSLSPAPFTGYFLDSVQLLERRLDRLSRTIARTFWTRGTITGRDCAYRKFAVVQSTLASGVSAGFRLRYAYCIGAHMHGTLNTPRILPLIFFCFEPVSLWAQIAPLPNTPVPAPPLDS